MLSESETRGVYRRDAGAMGRGAAGIIIQRHWHDIRVPQLQQAADDASDIEERGRPKRRTRKEEEGGSRGEPSAAVTEGSAKDESAGGGATREPV